MCVGNKCGNDNDRRMKDDYDYDVMKMEGQLCMEENMEAKYGAYAYCCLLSVMLYGI